MARNGNTEQTASSRGVIGATLYELASKHDNIWIVTPDIGGNIAEFKAAYPDRFIDVGIAEQNAMGVAAGLALEGNVPFVLGMAPFLSMRACEQVRTAICYQNLPVRIIATNSGTASNSGSTHYGMEDLALMKSLVNMTVISISDPNMIGELIRLSMDYPGPMYFRLARGKEDPVIYEPHSVEYAVGKALKVKEGSDVTIFSHGEVMVEALKAADMLELEGIHVRVIDMFTIKPLDVDVVMCAIEETGRIIVLEDHLMDGGLASSIADALVDRNLHPKAFKRLGVPQVYPGFGGGPALRRKYGYDAEAVIEIIRTMIK